MYATVDSFTSYLGGTRGVQSLLPDASERDALITNALTAASARINGVLSMTGYDVPVIDANFVTGTETEGMALLALTEMQLSGGILLAGVINTPRQSLIEQYKEAVQWLKDLIAGNVTVPGLKKKGEGVPQAGQSRVRVGVGNRYRVGEHLNELRALSRRWHI